MNKIKYIILLLFFTATGYAQQPAPDATTTIVPCKECPISDLNQFPLLNAAGDTTAWVTQHLEEGVVIGEDTIWVKQDIEYNLVHVLGQDSIALVNALTNDTISKVANTDCSKISFTDEVGNIVTGCDHLLARDMRYSPSSTGDNEIVGITTSFADAVPNNGALTEITTYDNTVGIAVQGINNTGDRAVVIASNDNTNLGVQMLSSGLRNYSDAGSSNGYVNGQSDTTINADRFIMTGIGNYAINSVNAVFQGSNNYYDNVNQGNYGGNFNSFTNVFSSNGLGNNNTFSDITNSTIGGDNNNYSNTGHSDLIGQNNIGDNLINFQFAGNENEAYNATNGLMLGFQNKVLAGAGLTQHPSILSSQQSEITNGTLGTSIQSGASIGVVGTDYDAADQNYTQYVGNLVIGRGLQVTPTPASTAGTVGEIGQILWDDNFLYVKTTVGWKRVALSNF